MPAFPAGELIDICSGEMSKPFSRNEESYLKTDDSFLQSELSQVRYPTVSFHNVIFTVFSMSYLFLFHIFSGSIAGMSGTRSIKVSSSPRAFRRERR